HPSSATAGTTGRSGRGNAIMSDSGDEFRFLFATRKQPRPGLRRTEIRYDSPSDNGNRSSTDDGRRLPAMRDHRLVGQADDQQAALTVARRYQSRHAFWLNALVSSTARMFLRPD